MRAKVNFNVALRIQAEYFRSITNSSALSCLPFCFLLPNFREKVRHRPYHVLPFPDFCYVYRSQPRRLVADVRGGGRLVRRFRCRVSLEIMEWVLSYRADVVVIHVGVTMVGGGSSRRGPSLVRPGLHPSAACGRTLRTLLSCRLSSLGQPARSRHENMVWSVVLWLRKRCLPRSMQWYRVCVRF